MSTTFAGSAKEKVEDSKKGTMSGKEYIDTLYYTKIIEARNLIIKNFSLVDGITGNMTFVDIFQKFCQNLNRFKEYVKRNVSTPDSEKVDGKKLEAVWIG